MTGWRFMSTEGVGISNTGVTGRWTLTEEQLQAILAAAAKAELSVEEFIAQFSSFSELLTAVFEDK